MLSSEWLLANGLGGFAMGTALGAPIRRYHALLIAATNPPGGRIMALSQMVEQIVLGAGPDQRSIDLSTFQFRGNPPVVHPRGHAALVRFEKDLSARWIFRVEGFEITKQVHLPRDANAVVITYRVRRDAAPPAAANSKRKKPAAPLPARLSVRPLVGLRDMHSLMRRGSSDRFRVEPNARGAVVGLDGRDLFLSSDSAAFSHEEQWWYDFFYQADADRGQDSVEDLYSPGAFEVPIPDSGQLEFSIRASMADAPLIDAEADRAGRAASLSARCASITARIPAAANSMPVIAPLVAAADCFVVRRTRARGTDGSTWSIIAGYPWFSDWGRDSLVSIPGLLLATGRFDEAFGTLRTFAAAIRGGIIPNLFDDTTGNAEYNTVDASLWFLHSACAYLEASADRAGFDAHLRDACIDIVDCYRRGTEFNIAMDPIDKLITAGTSATQLTWMDARRDGVTFTPRFGKAVEINALWYSGLRSLAAAVAQSLPTAAANLADLAEAAGKSFARQFWNENARCLYDCLVPAGDGGGKWTPDASIRPNQVFAASLPFSPLNLDHRRAVVECVRARLLTPMGVRTLDPADGRYRGRYEGNLFERDAAYHQGTAWPWLLGPVAEAVLRIGGFSDAARREARAILEPVIAQMSSETGPACFGQIAEIYDGSAPQRASGCPAQAWSVAEVLRAFLLTLVPGA